MKNQIIQGDKLRGHDKTARIPVKIAPQPEGNRLRKPSWIRASFPGSVEVVELKKILRDNKLHTVCEEAACPNLGECFKKGTATFLVMGDICTRRCPFCDVAHGRPLPLDENEPRHLAETIAKMGLRYVVITSVNRDDLRDGGAEHIMHCVRETRLASPEIQIEILTPDFRGRTRQDALRVLAENPPDVFNHNLETVPRLYPQARPGADYEVSLQSPVGEIQAHNLSAGQKAITAIAFRLAVAKAMEMKIGCWIIDEPTQNIGKAEVEALAEVLADTSKIPQIVIATHHEALGRNGNVISLGVRNGESVLGEGAVPPAVEPLGD